MIRTRATRVNSGLEEQVKLVLGKRQRFEATLDIGLSYCQVHGVHGPRLDESPPGLV